MLIIGDPLLGADLQGTMGYATLEDDDVFSAGST
jgi:hypothetical protein